MPTVVSANLSVSIVEISCGGEYTLALLADGRVWQRTNTAANFIQKLEDKQVVKLACGLWDAVALTGSTLHSRCY